MCPARGKITGVWRNRLGPGHRARNHLACQGKYCGRKWQPLLTASTAPSLPNAAPRLAAPATCEVLQPQAFVKKKIASEDDVDRRWHQLRRRVPHRRSTYPRRRRRQQTDPRRDKPCCRRGATTFADWERGPQKWMIYIKSGGIRDELFWLDGGLLLSSAGASLGETCGISGNMAKLFTHKRHQWHHGIYNRT